MTEQQAHAKYRPPSSAARWLSCPESAYIMHLYPNEQSDASLKGDEAHDHLENGLLFGMKPDTQDPDMDMNIMDMLQYVADTKKAYGGDCVVYPERQYNIPETGEFGTADVTFVTPKVLHIADYKDGYVPVGVKMNAQMMTYLLGAIAEFGERKTYKITVMQPNYNHADGPIRTVEVSAEEVEWFRQEVKYAVNARGYQAGKHCKKTYCPHRGTCAAFHEYAENALGDAYYTSDLNGVSNEKLAQALDHAEILQGWRKELRTEAMRRVLQQDANIAGYKVVRSRVNREFKDDAARDAVYTALLNMGYEIDDLTEKEPINVAGHVIQSQKPLTVAGVERMVKQKYKSFGRGKWKAVWDEYIQDHIREFSGSLTLERAIDGRPAHKRGSEFGSLASPAQPEQVSTSSKSVSII